MSNKEAFHPDGSKITFNEEQHSYIHENNRHISVTTLLNNYFPKFDAEKISYFVAKKRGISQEEVLKEWDDNRDAACAYGTAVHLYAEMRLVGGILPKPANEREEKAFQVTEIALQDLLTKYNVVEAEKIIFSKKYKIAGTIDLVIQNKETGELGLLDYKTNKSIDKATKYSKQAFPPIDTCNDANFTKYSLQLNLYKRLLEEEGYFGGRKINELILLHIKSDDTEEYVVPDMQKEIKLLLEHYMAGPVEDTDVL